MKTFNSSKLSRPAILTAIILLIPLVAMQFSEDVDWGLFDFVIIGLLVFVIGVAYEMLSSKFKGTQQRVAIGGVLLVILVLIWAELAVGIFNTPFAGS